MSNDNNNDHFNHQIVVVEAAEAEDEDGAALAVVAARQQQQQPSRNHNNNNNNNNNARSFLAIEDESEWFRRHGLPPNEGDGAYYEWYGGSNLSETNQQEARQRVQDEASYQRQIHRRVFRRQKEQQQQEQEGNVNDDHDNTDPPHRKNNRRQQLESWKTMEIRLQVAESQEEVIWNLKDLATYSDTVYTMANSYPLFNHNNNNYNNDRETTATTTTTTPALSMSLKDFSKDAVENFLKLLKQLPPDPSLTNNNNDNDNTMEDDDDDDASDSTPPAFDYERLLEDNHHQSEYYIIDYCRLAHYLQCTTLLEDGIIPILIRSVDSSNCMSLCQLADQLHMPSLLEASMNHMMLSLGSLEESELWNDLTPELRDRITTIRGILSTSNRRQLYFSSFTEYLAMFAEQVEYYQERLADAILAQERNVTQPRHSTRGWEYAQTKITQQQERVKTLKLVLKEQKKLFGKKELW